MKLITKIVLQLIKPIDKLRDKLNNINKTKVNPPPQPPTESSESTVKQSEQYKQTPNSSAKP
mgnify:CR=1 FL=1|jgi:hypothetical protein